MRFPFVAIALVAGAPALAQVPPSQPSPAQTLPPTQMPPEKVKPNKAQLPLGQPLTPGQPMSPTQPNQGTLSPEPAPTNPAGSPH
jgi:hypothetical protein